jgi:hypothetical protein
MAIQREHAIRSLLATLDAYLGRFDGPGVTDVRAGIAAYGEGALQEVVPGRVPATYHADDALSYMRADGEGEIAAAVEAAMPFLAWGAYDPYPRAEIGDKYAENHAAASIIGSAGHFRSGDFDLGLFVFGPDTLYRDHHHAAPELYAPFTGPNGWRFATGTPLEWRPAHQPVWNEAWAQHAIKSGPQPFFCVYGWTRDVNVPAKMIVEPDWAALEAQAPL